MGNPAQNSMPMLDSVLKISDSNCKQISKHTLDKVRPGEMVFTLDKAKVLLRWQNEKDERQRNGKTGCGGKVHLRKLFTGCFGTGISIWSSC